MKVENGREEAFAKGNKYKTNYLKNDNISCYNTWSKDLSTKGYIRSQSNPRFFRTQLNGTYQRDNSKYMKMQKIMRKHL